MTDGSADGPCALAADAVTALDAAIARAVPAFADWCTVDHYVNGSTLALAHSEHPDPRKQALILEIRRRYRAERGENGDVLAALRTGEVLLYGDMSEIASIRLNAGERRLLGELGLKSSIVVPISSGGLALGVVSFVSTSRHYDEADLPRALELASGCAEAIASSWLGGTLEERAELLDALYGSAPVGLAFVDREMLVRRVNDELASYADIAARGLVAPVIGEAFGGLGEQLAPFVARALAEREPVRGEELVADTPDAPGVARHWLVSIVPVTVAREPVGANVAVLDVTERRRAEARAAFLADVGEIIDSSLDYRDTLRRVARLAVPTIADWCSISMLDERGRLYRLAVAHRDPERNRLAQQLIEREAIRSDAPTGAPVAIRMRETHVLDDVPDDLLIESLSDERSREIIRTLGLRALITVPLVAHGRVLGAISLVAEAPGRFTEHDVAMAEGLARRAALGIDNARRYTAHRRIADILQAGLRPTALPAIPGLDLGARYRPAGELGDVGGDFFDAYLRPSSEWLVVIGDVTGKGAEAAATTALVRYTLRAIASHPGSPPRLLRELNDAMRAQRAYPCTIALVSVRHDDAGRPAMTVTLAGHPPPILLRASGEPRAVGSHGTVLAAAADPEFTEVDVRLGDGDILLLYTDGLTEAAAPPAWTDEQLAEHVRGAPNASLHELLAHLERIAVAEAGGRPRDDIALLAMRAAGAGG